MDKVETRATAATEDVPVCHQRTGEKGNHSLYIALNPSFSPAFGVTGVVSSLCMRIAFLSNTLR